jgi:hypothetical protein
MAWSPVRRVNAGLVRVEAPGDYATQIPTSFATAPSKHPEATFDKGLYDLLKILDENAIME